MSNITKLKRDRYLKNGGAKCPFCDSENLEASKPFVSDYVEEIYCIIDCMDCGEQWTDHYGLVNITVDEE